MVPSAVVCADANVGTTAATGRIEIDSRAKRKRDTNNILRCTCTRFATKKQQLPVRSDISSKVILF